MYFSKQGKHTTAVAELVAKCAIDHNIAHVVVASNSGSTALALLNDAYHLVCVTHQVGFREPGVDEMPAEMRKTLAEAKVDVLTTTHLMGGIERAALRKNGGNGIQSITASTLRMFGQGTKVCLEIACMALDAGLIPYGEDIIAVGGTGRGVDAAWIIRPAHSHAFYDSKVKQLICKPSEF